VRIAVIGGGIAGIVAAYLLDRQHQVTLFEKNGYVGGHTHTFVVPDGPDAGTPVDTGFIVLNQINYPLFTRFLEQLEVRVRGADMSFGYCCEQSGLEYAGPGLDGLFAQRGNLLRPSFLGLLAEIARFSWTARRELRDGTVNGEALGDWLAQRRFSRDFQRHYLVPIASAIWSTTLGETPSYPARHFLQFFDNHGLLSPVGKPRWQTVIGGSHAYVQAFLKRFSGEVRTRTAVASVRRAEDAAFVKVDGIEEERFDAVVIGAHADEALAMLADPSEDERRLLGAWRYQRNRVVLHTDVRCLPVNRRAWASWNYRRPRHGDEAAPLAMTYHMNRLQGLRAQREYCVTLNREEPFAEGSVLLETMYTHPTYTRESVASQADLPRLNGARRTWFCGAYFGYGFHEDGTRSGVEAARGFGIAL